MIRMASKRTIKKTEKATHLSTSQKVGLGVGLTTAAVTAAGYYFLFGSEKAKQNRKKVKSWMLKAKAEVLEALEQGKDMTQEEYENLIDSVTSTYSRLKDASQTELGAFKREMKEHWRGIEQAAKPTKRATKKTTRQTTKKTTRKATKK